MTKEHDVVRMEEPKTSGSRVKRLVLAVFLIFVTLAMLNLYLCFIQCRLKFQCSSQSENRESNGAHLDYSPRSHLTQHIYIIPEKNARNVSPRNLMDSLDKPLSLANSKYDFASSVNGMQRKLPQVLIIGVKKGGTRALLQFLRLHPDIRASGRETHFFDKHYDRGLEWYRNKMPLSVDGQLTMEKTPSYFITGDVAERVYKMSRTQRLLVVVRDPVTRAISDYAQTISKKRKKKRKSFDDLAFLNKSTGLVDTYWSAIKIGLYYKYLEKWLKYFPLKQMHFVSGEGLIKDPAAELAKVQNFLNIKLLITRDHFYFNETKGFPCLKKSEGSGKPHCLGETKGRAHPLIKPSTIHRLRQFYRPFNLKFYRMAGIDFGWV